MDLKDGGVPRTLTLWGRIQKNGVKINLTKSVLFYRRLHSKGLTSDPKTILNQI